MKKIAFISLLAFAFIPAIASAHLPRVSDKSGVTTITDPEISKAYYGILTGEPHTYLISSDKPFEFYMNVLMPDLPGSKKDVSAALVETGDTEFPIAIITSDESDWENFYEPFGNDEYLKGPETRQTVPAGTYEIRVWSSNNDSKYVLSVGEKESFTIKEVLAAYTTVPKIKSQMFGKSPLSAIFAPILYIPIIFFVVFVFLVLIVRRFLRHRF